jgi:hypothetical protein
LPVKSIDDFRKLDLLLLFRQFSVLFHHYNHAACSSSFSLDFSDATNLMATIEALLLVVSMRD